MSEQDIIDAIRDATEEVHDGAEGYFKASEIRALLAKIADAWDEGYHAGVRDEHLYAGPNTRNPYRTKDPA